MRAGGALLWHFSVLLFSDGARDASLADMAGENSLEGRGAVQQMLPDMIGPLVPLQGGIAGYKAGEQLEYVGGLIMPKGQDKDSGLRRKNFAEF